MKLLHYCSYRNFTTIILMSFSISSIQLVRLEMVVPIKEQLLLKMTLLLLREFPHFTITHPFLYGDIYLL